MPLRPSFLQLWLFVLMLTACASSPKAGLDKLHVGMDKDEVLSKVGDPKRTFRANTEDHWIYIYFEGDEEWDRQLDFRAGKLIKIGRAVPKKNWKSDLESANSMEEFEAKAREHQRKAGEFKSIDGSADPAQGK